MISTQPTSMMRSPSRAFSPVVSVSRTTCRVTWNPLVGQPVRPLVLRVTGVALHPVPLYLVARRQLVEALPQVDILDGFLVRGAPAASFPVRDPLRDALHHVERIGVELHAGRAFQRLERADRGGQLHPVIGGVRFPSVELFL